MLNKCSCKIIIFKKRKRKKGGKLRDLSSNPFGSPFFSKLFLREKRLAAEVESITVLCTHTKDLQQHCPVYVTSFIAVLQGSGQPATQTKAVIISHKMLASPDKRHVYLLVTLAQDSKSWLDHEDTVLSTTQYQCNQYHPVLSCSAVPTQGKMKRTIQTTSF